MKYFGILVSASILFVSCGNNSNNQSQETANEESVTLAAPTCSYTYLHENTQVEWTAYKTNEKIPVGGKFDEMKVMTIETADEALEILKNVRFEINTSSTNTNLPERDEKIKAHFFGKLSNPEMIKGNVVAVSGDEKAGQASLQIEMNGLSKTVDANYLIDGSIVSLETSFDVETWDGAAAIAALNEVCYDLHKGSDGVSKLWSNVSVKVSTTLQKTCD